MIVKQCNECGKQFSSINKDIETSVEFSANDRRGISDHFFTVKVYRHLDKENNIEFLDSDYHICKNCLIKFLQADK